MVRPAVVLNYIGKIIAFIGIAMLAVVACALIYGENTVGQLLLAAVITITIGGSLSWFFRHNQTINYRETFAVVGLGWLAASLVGTLPFYSPVMLVLPMLFSRRYPDSQPPEPVFF